MGGLSQPSNRVNTAIKSILRSSVVGFVAVAMVGGPAQLLAQNTNKAAKPTKAAAEKKEPAKSDKKRSAHPFRGKLAGLDRTAKSIQIGKSTYYVTPETRITKGGKPATFEDGVIGEEAGGYAKPGAGGKMLATSLRLGPKPEGTSAEKKSNEKKKSG